jgi:tetratricopeptide (TPR) repeat protein
MIFQKEIPIHLVAWSLLVLFVAAPVSLSQSKGDNPKLRVAQNLERSGKLEEAAEVYKELLNTEPTNVVFFDGVRRTFLQLKRYDELAVLLQEKLASSPDDVALRAQLGNTLYKGGREAEADAEWEKALAADPKNPGHYRTVAAVLMENRLLEKTADLYRKARVACNDPHLFTMELAQLLSTSMDYRGATVEFLRWLKKNPNQLSFVQSRMAAITAKEEGRRDALAVVEDALLDEEDVRLYELKAWLLIEGKYFKEALDVYRRIDQLSNTKGTTILVFADRAFKEGAFDVAASAYQEAMRMPLAAARIPAAKYGYASCLKEAGILSDTSTSLNPTGEWPVRESSPQYAGAIAAFKEIIEEYPGTEYSARSHFQIGLIQFERLFDLDGALQSFAAVGRELPERNFISYAVDLKMGEVLTAKGDTATAAARFRDVVIAPNATPDQQDEAVYRLAQLEYFRGDFKSAQARLSELTLNLHADYANDALQMLVVLQENSTAAPQALKEFARADYLSHQRRNTEAIPILLTLINQNPQALLIDDALMKAGTLQSEAGLYRDAIETYERLLSQFSQTSISLDRAQFKIGEIYQYYLRDKTQAIGAYEKLLANFPQSLHITEARKRIRVLRGESIN